MRPKSMIACLTLLSCFFHPAMATAKVGEYRGYIAAESLISERLLLEGAPFSFSTYSNGQRGLLNLLGFYESDGENSFRNGQPNSINMLMWQMVLQGFASDVAAHCTNQSRLLFQPVFRSTLDTLCRWPSPEAQDDATMRMFWLSVMSYDAPEEEYLAWRDFFLRSSYVSRPASEAVSALILSILYNPHFLLRK